MSGEAQAAQVTVDWIHILPLLLGSAAIAALISAILNYFLTRRLADKKTEMEYTKDKLDLYSSIVYHLDKMKFKGDALSYYKKLPKGERFVFDAEEWQRLVKDIDAKIQDRYYLLNREILARWVWARTLQTHESSAAIVSELRTMLVKEYNEIIDKHLSDLHDIVPKISEDPELIKSTTD